MSTNTQLRSLPTGAIFRSYRNAPTTWRIDKIAEDRVFCHNLFQVSREIDCSPSMSVWAVRPRIAPCTDERCPCETGEVCSFA